LHAGAWTNVGRRGGRPAGRGGGQRRRNAERRIARAPLVYYSTDYVFDGTKRTPYVESDAPNPTSAYGRTKLHGEAAAGDRAWVVRSSWLFGPTGHNFVRTMLRLGAERDEVAVVDDQRGSPTYVAHLAEATKELVQLPFGVYHVAAQGDCSWAELAEAIFEEAGLDTRVRRISTQELGRPHPGRPTPSSAPRNRRPRFCRTGVRAYAHAWTRSLPLPDHVARRRSDRARVGRDLRDRALARRGGAACRA
jgi:dTDP-4-dehydrorhamnose reductase